MPTVRHSALGIDVKTPPLRAALGVLACTLTALLYQRTLDHPFVFDDRAAVLLNPSLIDAWSLRAALLLNPARSVVNLSFALDRAFWGFSSFGYHITNGILHVVVVGLFFGCCTRALADADTSESEWPAFFAATVFGVHPLMSSTVLYVSARSDLLCAAGFLLSLMFARRAIVMSSPPAGLFAAFCGLFALASGPTAAALPLVVLAYDAWILRDRGWPRRAMRIYLPAMAAIAVAGIWQARAVLSANRMPPRGLIANLLTESIVIWRYLRLLLAPYGQSMIHDVHWARSPADPLGLCAVALLGISIVTAIRVRHSRPLVAFGIVWFAAALAPTSTILPLRDAMSEHRAYFAAAGLFLAAASVLARLLASSRLARAIAVAALLLCGVLTLARTRVWDDPLTLWTEAIDRAPGSWQAHLGYADALRELDRCGPAREEYRTALQLYPANADARRGLERCP
jgi:protein O-mannosyl-transferase